MCGWQPPESPGTYHWAFLQRCLRTSSLPGPVGTPTNSTPIVCSPRTIALYPPAFHLEQLWDWDLGVGTGPLLVASWERRRPSRKLTACQQIPGRLQGQGGRHLLPRGFGPGVPSLGFCVLSLASWRSKLHLDGAPNQSMGRSPVCYL